MSKLLSTLFSAQSRKFWMAFIGIVAGITALGLLPPDVARIVDMVVGALTAAGVYAVPNAPAPVIVPPNTEPSTPVEHPTVG